MSTDLKIRVISQLQSTEFFTIYQQDINTNVKNYKVGAWEKQYIAPSATFYTILPINIQVQGRNEQGTGIYKTKIVDVSEYNTSYEVYEKDLGLDIKPSAELAPTEGTVNIYNKCGFRKEAVVLKNGKPLFCASVRPENKLNFEIKNSLYIAICDYEIIDEFFTAASLTPTRRVDFSGQSFLTIYLKENTGTGKFNVEYDFNSFEYPADQVIR